MDIVIKVLFYQSISETIQLAENGIWINKE